MYSFALSVYVIHTLFEFLFGASAFLSGASSSQSKADRAAQPVTLKIAFRFMGSALLALGMLGLVVILGPGVSSDTAKYVAVGLATFHGLGALGSIWTAKPSFDVYKNPMSLGAVCVHGLLAIGFIVIAI